MQYKIGVIGDEESVLMFRLFGFDVRFADTGEEASEILDELDKDNYGVIYLTESLAEQIQEKVRSYDIKQTPALILIPDRTGSKGVGIRRVNENVEKALGENIFN